MTFRLSTLLLSCAFLPLNGQEEALPLTPTEEQKQEEEKKNEDARFRIPLGAVISDVTLPYFGENHRQISLLTAEEMRVEGANPDLEPNIDPTEVQRLNGTGLKLWLFDKEGLVSSTTTIPKAQYHVKKEQLVTSGELFMQGADDQFSARSNGAIFTLKTGQAFFMGPGVTRFKLPKKSETAMNLRPLLPFTAAMQMLIAAPPELDPEHFEKFDRLTATTSVPKIDIEEHFKTAEDNNAALAKRVAEYLIKIGKTELLTQIAEPAPVQEEAVASDPFAEISKRGPAEMSIKYTKGAYMDSEALEVAYFGNITVEGRGIKMTCNKDLKVLFNPPAPKAPKPKKKGEKEEKKGDSPVQNFAGFGDLKQVTANGMIRISGVTKDGGEFHLGGDSALFEGNPQNPKKEGTITMRGDNLKFLKGDPDDTESKELLAYSYSTSKNSWVIIDIKPALDPSKSDIVARFSPGNWTNELIAPKKK